MAQVIGHISEISGLFYAKDSSGETRLLKLGDELFVGEIVVGDDLNSAENILKFSVNGNGKEISVLADNQLLLDSTILPVELALDNVVQPQDIEEALLLDATYSDDELAAKTAEELPVSAENLDELEAPAAGDAEVDTLVGRFSDRTAGETDISTDLRDATFTDSTVTVAEDVEELGNAVLTLTATPQLTEDGGTIVYTVTVDNTPQSDILITLSNGETITIAAGTTTGSTSVVITESQFEDVYIDSDSIDVSITSAIGGNFLDIEYTTNGSVSTAIVDTIDATIVTVSNINAELVTEDTTTVTYEVKVDNPVTQTPLEVTVELMDGDTDDVIGVNTITIPVGAISASGDIELTEDYSDVYNDSGSIKAIIVGTSGGNYEALDTTSTDVTSLVDTLDTTTVTLTTTDVPETGTEVVFNIKLSNPPEGGTGIATVQVAGESGTRAVAIDSNGEGSFAVAFSDDDVYNDADSISAEVTAVTGNFENVSYANASATSTITEVQDTTTLTITESINSNGDYIYTGTVDNTPDIGTQLVVTLSNGETITINNTETSGESVASSTQAASVTTSGGNYENLNIIHAFGDVSDVSEDNITEVVNGSISTSGSIINIEYDGIVYTDDNADGIITIDTDAGELVVYTNDVGSNTAGDYIYTLDTATQDVIQDDDNDPLTIDLNSIEDFTYTVEDEYGNETSGVITVNIEDSVPTIEDPQNALLTNADGNVISGIDLDIESGADIPTSIILTPQVGTDPLDTDTFGFAIDVSGNLLTSTVNDVTYKLTYTSNPDGSVTAVNEDGTDIFILTPNTTNNTYSVDIVGTLDGQGYTTEDIFSGTNALHGGMDPVLVFNVADLYVVTTAVNDSGEHIDVNFNNAGGGDIGVAGGATVTNGETLILNFSDPTVLEHFNDDVTKYDTDNDGDFTDEGKISKLNHSEVLDIKEDAQDSTKPLTDADFVIGKFDDGDTVSWEVYNNSILVSIGEIVADETVVDYNKISVSSEVDSITLTATQESAGWSDNSGIISYSDNGTVGGEITTISYTISGVSYTADVTFNDGESVNLNQFNELQFTTPVVGDTFSISEMYATNPVDIEGVDYSINVGVEATDTDGDMTSGVFQVSFDGDGVMTYDSNSVFDGGTGEDTLLVGDDALLDFSSLSDGNVSDIENVDLRGGTSTTVENVTLESVFDMTDSNNVLHILGDSGDKVQSDDTGWSKVGTAPMDGITYNQYEGTYYDGTDNHTVYVNVQDTIDEEIV